MKEEGTVSYEVTDKVGVISFETPHHNALPSHLLSELVQNIEYADDDEQAAIILLKSGGSRTFCAGASFHELATINNEKEGKAFFLGFANVINAIRKCSKLVICRVQGKAVGGGVGIAAACDYSMSTKHASIKLSELAIGIGPFVIGPAVERKIGISAFSQLAINAAEWRTAQWAKKKGLFTEAFESLEQLDEYIEHFTAQLVSRNPLALAALKKVLWEGTEDWGDLLEKRAEMSGSLVLSSEAKSAIQGFLST